MRYSYQTTFVETDKQAMTPQPCQRSFLRSLIPFSFKGRGNASIVLRKSFLRHEHLIARFLGSLEAVPLPPMPRMMAAEGFQMLLDGRHEQREIRTFFEDAEIETRRILGEESGEMANPIVRLLAMELQAACSYYVNLLGVSASAFNTAPIAVRSGVCQDMKKDQILTGAFMLFDQMPRDPVTGAREPHLIIDPLVQEYFMVERDTLGKHRLDCRGDTNYLLHCLKIDDITKTEATMLLLKDPCVLAFGNFCLASEPIHQGRWLQYKLTCGTEEHRVEACLPSQDTFMVQGEGWECEVTLVFDSPLCERTQTIKSNNPLELQKQHVETFVMAVPDTNLTFFERWFQR